MLIADAILTLGAAPGSLRGQLTSLTHGAVLGLLAAKLLTVRYGGFKRMRNAAARGEKPGRRILALAPAVLVAWAATDRANLAAFLRWAARRPLPPRPPGIDVPFSDKSAYGTLFICVLVSLFVELPMDGLIASVMAPDPATRTLIRWGLAAAGAYTLIWILGDRRQMQEGYQVVGAEDLHLKVGGRLAASIPRRAILRCESVSESKTVWCDRNGVDDNDAVVATPADTPNAMIEIDPAAGLRLRSWNVEIDAPRHLFLFADTPADLVRHLSGTTRSA